MALSLRMQSLAKNPQIQRSSFREMAAKMMGQQGVTNTARKEMQKAGVYFGEKKLSKVKFEKNLRKFSQHLGERGGQETRFAKQIRQSLRSQKGLVRGGVAEREFHRDLKRQYKESSPPGGFETLEFGVKRKLIHKYLEKGIKGLTPEDRHLLGDDGLAVLKERGERIKAINQSRQQREREEENKQAKEGSKSANDLGVSGEKATTSGAKEDYTQQSASSAPKNSSPISLAGGAHLGIGMIANQIEGGVERSMNAKLNSQESQDQKSPTKASLAENSANKQDLPEEGSYQSALDELIHQDPADIRQRDNWEDRPNHQSQKASGDESENKAFDPYGGEDSSSDVDVP